MAKELRAEEGERTGRFHFHYFLAGLLTRAACPTTCFFLMNLWKELRGGIALVSVFDPIGHIQKGERQHAALENGSFTNAPVGMRAVARAARGFG